ncbi:MAG: hypothetical protein ABI724_04140 [Betaproteobacteria bacterium]
MLADIAAFCMVSLSAYAQWAIPRHTKGSERIWFARALLVGLGTALGVLAASSFMVQDTSTVALFCIAFGQVHVPAAVVLFLKGGDKAVGP